MNQPVTEIRGHHLLGLFYCFLPKDKSGAINYNFKYFASRKKYGKEFSKNERKIMRELLFFPNKKIKLLAGMEDDICRHCPRTDCPTRIGKPNYEYDKDTIKTLGCGVNGVYTLDEILKKGKGLIELYKKALPLKRGRPKKAVSFGKILAEYAELEFC